MSKLNLLHESIVHDESPDLSRPIRATKATQTQKTPKNTGLRPNRPKINISAPRMQKRSARLSSERDFSQNMTFRKIRVRARNPGPNRVGLEARNQKQNPNSAETLDSLNLDGI